MPAATRTRRGLQIFGRKNAPRVDDTAMMSPPALDQAARDALPEFRAGRGSVTKLVYGDPGAPGGGAAAGTGPGSASTVRCAGDNERYCDLTTAICTCN